ncbi:OstA-like protein [Flavobacterium cerinum]|uniref:OstA-like protein n=1 Tax=Flavobacterium cerinum TaxID=2502784 RepID=A0A3S3QU03_9FLAO|nr:OstA-like protein [Flavobacterium cerinum]RWW92065.1 OstA-like protein [Flavobacterium cerinum]
MKKLFFLFISFSFFWSHFSIAQEKKKIILEYADFTDHNQTEIPGAVVLIGNVRVNHDGAIITCNKAYQFIDENYIKLFGNVKINQGDTLFMDSRYAEYNGDKKFAYATGNVNMRSPEMSLVTDTINLDRNTQQAYYNSYGTIVSGENTLKSKSGRFFIAQKKYQFLTAVTLTNPKYVMKTNHLDYYTNSGHSYVFGPTTITGKDSFIYTEKGFYDTKKNLAHLLTKSYIKQDTQIIKGDSLYYDRNKQFSSATRNVSVTDTVNKFKVMGHYAEVYKMKDSLFIEKRALAVTQVENDSLYTHAKRLVVTGKPGSRIMRGYNNARFYKTDMSGKCDSIHSDEARGLTQLIKRPVVWNGDSQLTGDVIHIISNSKTEQIDSLKVLSNAFIIQKDTLGTGYNQIKGKNLYGKFRDNKLYQVDLIGNAEKIFYMYDKEVLFGIDKGVGSRIHLELKDNQITSATLFKKTESQIYPDAELPQNVRKLRGFIWRGDEIIKTKDDIFPPEEQEIHDKIVKDSDKNKDKVDTPMTPSKETLNYDKNNPKPKPKKAPVKAE